MPGVKPEEGESFKRALRRFRKRREKAGLLSDLDGRPFETPSERKKRKKAAAKRKLRKLKLKLKEEV